MDNSFDRNQQCGLESKKAKSIFDFISKKAASRSKVANPSALFSTCEIWSTVSRFGFAIHERYTEASLVKGYQGVFRSGDDDDVQGEAEINVFV